MLTVEPFASDDNHHGGGLVTYHVTLILICNNFYTQNQSDIDRP